MEYRIEIDSLHTKTIDDTPNVVVNVCATVFAKLGNQENSYSDIIQVSLPDFTNFTEYNELTKEQIISWISENIEEMKEKAAFVVNRAITELNVIEDYATEAELPWSNT